MIKAVIFDWGGVLSPSGTPDELSENLANNIGVSGAEAKRLVKLGTDKLKRAEIDEDEFWQIISSDHGADITQDQRNVWIKTEDLEPVPEMLNYIQKLRDMGLKIAILSNTFPATASAIRAQGWYDGYDVVLASSEVGLAKPDPEFYQLCLDKLGVTGEEAVFIDDQQYCLDAAMPFGIHTLLAINPTQIINEVDALLRLSS